MIKETEKMSNMNFSTEMNNNGVIRSGKREKIRLFSI